MYGDVCGICQKEGRELTGFLTDGIICEPRTVLKFWALSQELGIMDYHGFIHSALRIAGEELFGEGVELCCGSPDPAKEDCGVHTPKRATPNSDILRWRSYIIYKNAIMYIYIYVTYIIQ